MTSSSTGPARLTDQSAHSRRQGPGIFDDVNVEVVEFARLSHRNAHHHGERAPFFSVLFVVTFLVGVGIGEHAVGRVFVPVLLRFPVGIAAMARGGTTALDQAGVRAAVEYPGR